VHVLNKLIHIKLTERTT